MLAFKKCETMHPNQSNKTNTYMGSPFGPGNPLQVSLRYGMSAAVPHGETIQI